MKYLSILLLPLTETIFFPVNCTTSFFNNTIDGPSGITTGLEGAYQMIYKIMHLYFFIELYQTPGKLIVKVVPMPTAEVTSICAL